VGLLPGGSLLFENLQRSGAIQRAFEWVNGEIARLDLSWATIGGLLRRFIDSLGWSDVLNPGAVLDRAAAIFGPPLARIRALTGAGLTLPQRWDLRGILSIVLQVLGLTYARLRERMVRLIGAPRVALLEQAFDFLRLIATQGLAAVWQRILEYASGLVDTVV